MGDASKRSKYRFYGPALLVVALKRLDLICKRGLDKGSTMPRPIPLFPKALKALQFTAQEKTASQIGPDGLTDEHRAENGKVLGPARILELVDRFYQSRLVTDAIAEFVPRLRERVCVEGRDEVFVVIYVDRDRAVADLVSTERVGDLLESVPFSAMYPAEPLRAA